MNTKLAQDLTGVNSMMSLQGIGGGFMSLALKEAKDELRLVKKAEQLTKDKLQETNKKLE